MFSVLGLKALDVFIRLDMSRTFAILIYMYQLDGTREAQLGPKADT